ncbi:MAG: hypothetical protein HKN26_01725 [Acidimicrobiales bacterium]|nr:hypothetical protein [Acidimicrobiales bacterium]
MFAYFDAGTGSMILSFFAAGFAGIVVFGKSLWYKIAFWRKDDARTLDVDTELEIDPEVDAALDAETDGGLDLGEIDDSELEIG